MARLPLGNRTEPSRPDRTEPFHRITELAKPNKSLSRFNRCPNKASFLPLLFSFPYSIGSCWVLSLRYPQQIGRLAEGIFPEQNTFLRIGIIGVSKKEATKKKNKKKKKIDEPFYPYLCAKSSAKFVHYGN